MKGKHTLLLAAIAAGIAYGIGWLLTPIEIKGIHTNNNFSFILVNKFPVTDKGKIAWWSDNKASLTKKYGVPAPDSNGYYTVVIWDFGDGYREMPDVDQGSDLLCFDDMKTTFNCLEKPGSILRISRFDGGKTSFHMSNGHTYLQLSDKSELKRVE
ncbi:DUF943 family protein [Chimaeribacter arupi]|uniref:DUF943 family protein n=1 Tax=Chimaeribacter arupi TaxID=2060066 RepID=UPI0027120854|nr:DUF943 family protein [Chimaeribacter arupi]WKZ91641.1 DUF943 family protein [Chimaeribacter arupi]